MRKYRLALQVVWHSLVPELGWKRRCPPNLIISFAHCTPTPQEDKPLG
jgi:hypothetical protein